MKTSVFESLSLDQALDLLISRTARLSRVQMAALFGCLGTALLPLYIRFSEKNGWGNPDLLRTALEAALGYAMGGPELRRTGTSMVQSIANVTPDEQEFETPESTFAMDVAICVDAAVRAADPEQDVDPRWIEYALDPSVITLCEQETGYLDLGSSTRADEWRSQALKNPQLSGAFGALAEMTDLLSEVVAAFSCQDLKMLQPLAARLLPRRYVSS